MDQFDRNDPLKILDINSKAVAGKYVFKKDDDEEEKPFEKWTKLSTDKDKYDNEPEEVVKVYGNVRVDSQNKPSYHGQFDRKNLTPRIKIDKIEQEVSIKSLASSDDLEQIDEQDVYYPKNPAKIEPEPAPSYENSFPPASKVISIPPKLGTFDFGMNDFWLEIMNSTEKKVNAKTIHFLARNAHLMKNKQNQEKLTNTDDESLLEAAKLAKSEPIKSSEPVLNEIDDTETLEAKADGNDESTESSDELQTETNEKAEQELDGIITANDYLTKLREGKIKPVFLSENILKAAIKPAINLDSQGFNSFIDYAPNLSKLRKSELIKLLASNVLFSDNGVLIINKPYGLICQGKIDKGNKMFYYNLIDILPEFAHELVKKGIIKEDEQQLRLCHRLDKDATGCLVLATNPSKAAQIQELFAESKVFKEYTTITKLVPDPEKGIIDIPIEDGSVDGKERMVLRPVLREELRRIASPSKMAKRAVTSYSVIDSNGNAALVKVEPKTGVKHQIRVHMGFALRCPILGDHKYSYLEKIAPQKLPTDMLVSLNVRQSKVRNIPLHLHSQTVFLPQMGRNKSTIIARAYLPEFFQKTMKMLKLVKK